MDTLFNLLIKFSSEKSINKIIEKMLKARPLKESIHDP